MRIASDKPNTLRLYDNLSGSSLELYYATPTAAQHAAYTNGMTKRIQNKVVTCVGQNRQKHGLAILRGFRDGDFGEEINGEVKPVSSTPGKPGYREDWKEWFAKNCPDLVDILAVRVFEQSAGEDTGEDLPGDEGDDTDPS